MKPMLTLIGSALLSLTCALAQSVPGISAWNHVPEATASPSSEPAKPAGEPEAVTIPAGTRILMKLQSPLHTTSAGAGSGVYLETSMPVVQNDRVVIPAHTHVQGVVESERRPGRVKGRAQFRLRFTTLILPDNHVMSISGALQSLPGSPKNRAIDAEGTIEPVDQIDRDVYTVVRGATAGALVGSIVRGGLGTWPTAAVGGGLGLAKALFTRGDEIQLPVGSEIEMVLKRPLTVQ